jgi:hypothetical protein
MAMDRQSPTVGTATPQRLPHGHWKTSTFLGALRCDGLTSSSIFHGSINGELFLAYVEQILVPTLKFGDMVILGSGDCA